MDDAGAVDALEVDPVVEVGVEADVEFDDVEVAAVEDAGVAPAAADVLADAGTDSTFGAGMALGAAEAF